MDDRRIVEDLDRRLAKAEALLLYIASKLDEQGIVIGGLAHVRRACDDYNSRTFDLTETSLPDFEWQEDAPEGLFPRTVEFPSPHDSE